MQPIQRFEDAEGRRFSVPEGELDAFRADTPDAVAVHSFADAEGRSYSVPDPELEAFGREVPGVQRVHKVQAADGSRYSVPDSERQDFIKRFRTGEEFEADRAAITSEVEQRAAPKASMAAAVTKGAAVGAGLGIKDAGKGVSRALTDRIPELVWKPLAILGGKDVTRFGRFARDVVDDIQYRSEERTWDDPEIEGWAAIGPGAFESVATNLIPAVATRGSSAPVMPVLYALTRAYDVYETAQQAGRSRDASLVFAAGAGALEGGTEYASMLWGGGKQAREIGKALGGKQLVRNARSVLRKLFFEALNQGGEEFVQEGGGALIDQAAGGEALDYGKALYVGGMSAGQGAMSAIIQGGPLAVASKAETRATQRSTPEQALPVDALPVEAPVRPADVPVATPPPLAPPVDPGLTPAEVQPPVAPTEVQPPVAPTEVQPPVMITRKMEADLKARGLSQAEINKMTPQQANDALAEPVAPVVEEKKARVFYGANSEIGEDINIDGWTVVGLEKDALKAPNGQTYDRAKLKSPDGKRLAWTDDRDLVEQATDVAFEAEQDAKDAKKKAAAPAAQGEAAAPVSAEDAIAWAKNQFDALPDDVKAKRRKEAEADVEKTRKNFEGLSPEGLKREIKAKDESLLTPVSPPPGYVKEGDRYVFKGEAAAPAEPAQTEQPQYQPTASLADAILADPAKTDLSQASDDEIDSAIADIQERARGLVDGDPELDNISAAVDALDEESARRGVKNAKPALPASSAPKEVPMGNDGIAVGEVGDEIELENGAKAKITTTKSGRKKWTYTRGPKATMDYGKTWSEGLAVGDVVPYDDMFNGVHRLNEGGAPQGAPTKLVRVKSVGRKGYDYESVPDAPAAPPVEKPKIGRKVAEDAGPGGAGGGNNVDVGRGAGTGTGEVAGAGVDPVESAARRALGMDEAGAPISAGDTSPTTAPDNTASVPVMITRKMEADLKARGLSQAEINKMTPQQANDALAEPVASVVEEKKARVFYGANSEIGEDINIDGWTVVGLEKDALKAPNGQTYDRAKLKSPDGKRLAWTDDRDLVEQATDVAFEAEQDAKKKAAGRGGAQGMADVAPETSPGRMAPVETLRPADNPAFSIFPLELPEAVDFARQAIGRFPRVKATIRALNGTALGVYRSIKGQGPLGIELKRSIFNLLQPSDYVQAKRDAQAWAEQNWKPRMGGPSRDEAVNAWQQNRLQELSEQRLTENPQEASNMLWHELGHWIDDVSDWLSSSRGNILGHIATLHGYYKTMLSRLPPNDLSAQISKKDRSGLHRQAERESGKRPKTADVEQLKAWRKGVTERYGELLEAEAANRGLVTRKAILAELEPLIAWWHGTEKMPDYFSKPSEMYADAFSVLVNNPAAVQARAPTYYAVWQDWLVKKPAARDLWKKYQDDALLGRVGDMRDRRQIEGIQEANAQREKQLRAKLILSPRQSMDAIASMLFSSSQSIRRRVKSAKKRGAFDVAERVQKALQDDIYLHGWSMGYLLEVQDKVGRKVFKDAGIPLTEWQVFLQNRQIAENRQGIASMYGMNPAASTEALDRQRVRLGDPAYQAMIDAQAEWHKLRMQYVIKLALDKGLINRELADLMEQRAAYSHVAAVDVNMNPVQAVFQAIFGADVGAGIHKQEGFLGLAADPWLATLELDRNLIAAAQRNDLKNALAAMLADADEELYKPAGERWDASLQRMVPIVGKGTRASTLVAMRNGKPWSFWAPQEIVDFVQSADSTSGMVLTRLINTLLRKQKGIFTWLNYGFPIFNTPRDIQDWIKNLPGWKGRKTYNKYQTLAKPIVKSIVDGKPTGEAAGILRSNILLYFPQGMRPGDNSLVQQIGEKIGGQAGRMLEKVGPQTALERMVGAYDLRADWMGLDVTGREKVLEGIKRAYMQPNQRGEMERKVAAWLYLNDRYPDMSDAERQRNVQMMGGSPDLGNTPRSNNVIDAVLPFYNPFLRGWESGLKAFSEEPVRVTLTTLRYGIIPKLIMAAIGTGLLRDLLERTIGESGKWYGEELRKMEQYIPQYYKDNYAVHPLWWDPTDPTHTKVIFETSPLSESNRFLSAIVWKLLSKEDVSGLFDFGADQLPGLNPILTLGYQWSQVLQGEVPKRIGITQTQIDAGTAVSPMLRETFNQLSGGMVGRIPREGVSNINVSPLERFLRLPVISNTIGRRIRVSNRGWQEGLGKAASSIEAARAKVRQQAWHDAVEYGRSGALSADAAVRRARGAMVMSRKPAGSAPTAYMMTVPRKDGLDAYYAERVNNYILEVNMQKATPQQRAIREAPWTQRIEMLRGYGK